MKINMQGIPQPCDAHDHFRLPLKKFCGIATVGCIGQSWVHTSKQMMSPQNLCKSFQVFKKTGIKKLRLIGSVPQGAWLQTEVVLAPGHHEAMPMTTGLDAIMQAAWMQLAATQHR